MKSPYIINGKKNISPVLLLALIITASFTFQDDICRNFYPMETGKKFEHTHYNAKDKVESRVEFEVVEKNESGNTVSATIKMKGYDNKDKPVFDGDYKVYCEDGVFKIDVRGMLNSAQMQQIEAMKDMDVSIETQDLELPSSMKVGDQLKDGSINISVSAADGGMTIMNMNTNITDRKVVAEEKMTTPAGTFDCIVLTSTTHSKAGFVNVSYETKEWLAENVGLVRSETYRKGKLEGYTLLTNIK